MLNLALFPMGRGETCCPQRVRDLLNDPIRIVEDLVVPESDYSVAGAFDALSTYCIQPLSLVVSMCVAIEFDYKAGGEANEVRDVLAQRMLPAELVAVQLPPSKV